MVCLLSVSLYSKNFNIKTMRRPFQNVKSYFIIRKKTVVILVLVIAVVAAVIYFSRKKEPERVLPIVSP